MSFLLNIETATTVCSVSVSKNEELLSWMELDAGFTHAENLHIFIDECLAKAGIGPNALSAVAVSKGPGSYTGLRIGASTAKGMAYALNIPLIAIDTLKIMSAQAAKDTGDAKAVYCPMIDARRMEVYTCLYDSSGKPIENINAFIVDENSVLKYQGFPKIYFFGDGMDKCRALLNQLKGAAFLDHVKPSARYMQGLSYQAYRASAFENVAAFEPFYLKDFLPGISKKAI